ncbi:MAG: (deoxy)nucleoside triphosphate pyrophosphohydrolase [Spirochaetales bacterium]|nr:(deoxy)nucleoside triphosphate pyrophosphohydrolase [Spirochaetales bacterium]
MQNVTAAVIVKNGKYLIAKRQAGGSLGEKWEFPGGKVEPGETPEQGLAREIKEEFGVDVNVGKFIGSACFKNGDKEYQLMAYFTGMTDEDITLTVHDEIRWIPIDMFDDFDFAQSDKAIIKILQNMPPSA